MRYRMTVAVQTPQGIRTGSAVREVKVIYHDSWLENLPFPLEGGQAHVEFKGEGVAVDLPGGQTLFALLSSAAGDGDHAQNIPRDYIYISDNRADPPKTGEVEIWPHGAADQRSGKPAPPPMLVRFTDLTVGIGKRLVWLTQQKSQLVSAGPYDRIANRRVSDGTEGSFSLGVSK